MADDDKIWRSCIECGDEFYVTEKTQQRIRDKVARGEYERFHLPKRCFSCRQQRKHDTEVAETRSYHDVWDGKRKTS